MHVSGIVVLMDSIQSLHDLRTWKVPLFVFICSIGKQRKSELDVGQAMHWGLISVLVRSLFLLHIGQRSKAKGVYKSKQQNERHWLLSLVLLRFLRFAAPAPPSPRCSVFSAALQWRNAILMTIWCRLLWPRVSWRQHETQTRLKDWAKAFTVTP